MKHTKRKLLSLLLALAVMCSMVPAAMAADNITLNVGQKTSLTSSYAGTSLTYGCIWSSSDSSVVSVTPDYYSVVNGQYVASTTASITALAEGTATITAQTMYYGQEFGGNRYDIWTVTVTGSGVSSGTYCTLTPGSSSLSVGGTDVLTVIPSYGCTISSVSWSASSAAVSLANTTSTTTTVTGITNGTAVVTARIFGKDAWGINFSESLQCTVYVGSGSISTGDLFVSNSTLQLQVNGTPGFLSAGSSTYAAYLDAVQWSSSNTSVVQVFSAAGGAAVGSGVYVYGVASGQATVTATLYGTSNQILASASCVVTVGAGISTDTGHFYISPNSLQLDSNGSYTMLSAALYANSGMTAADLNNLVWYSSDPSVVNVLSTGSASNYATGASAYIYGVSAGKATIMAWLDSTHYATCEVTVNSGSTGIDVLYALTQGQSKALEVKDFTSFWTSAAGGRGTLQYVVFGSASGTVGKLTYTRSGSTAGQAVSGMKFYANPGSGQYGISSVTFTPNKNGTSYATGTLVVPFTAYGTSTNYGVATTASYMGLLYIVVTNGEIQAISYQTTASTIALNSTDFVNVYKQAVSTTSTNPVVYIQFLDAPVYGSLYYNYKASSYSTGVKLTASNIGSMRFSSRTTGAYGIDEVTYVPSVTGKSETIRYAAFSSAAGGTLLYVGEINFGVKEASAVKFYGATNSTVKLNSSTFYTSDALTYTEYISFSAPSSGTLYKDYANGSGTKVTAGSTFTLSTTGSYSVPSVNSLTFVPKAGFSGVVEIPFTCYNILGGQASGTVKIYIAKTFSDVPTSHWAYGYVTQLTAEGIVNGMTETTFAPSQNLKYGEALKLIMEAVGYPKLEKTGTHWASGYLSRAYRDGLVSSSNINLESYIDRTTVASITAKALGLSKATSINAGITGPSDSTDGYVYALYNAGILEGENRNGKNYYDGSSTLTRAQVCAIVCRVSEYNK